MVTGSVILQRLTDGLHRLNRIDSVNRLTDESIEEFQRRLYEFMDEEMRGWRLTNFIQGLALVDQKVSGDMSRS